LAALHARYWESDALQTLWLAPLRARFHILHPSSGIEELKRPSPAPVFLLVQRGWELALQTVPGRIATWLQRPAEEIAREFSYLPQTLLHGDTKVANFGFYPGGELAAFDWATMGRGPATIDLGYCLAINSRRLGRDKADVISRYRELMEQSLGWRILDDRWEDMVTAGVAAGAGMLLWSKALALADGAPGAADEWVWWVTELERRLV
jgi:aminoglycoside phosphotransferase (APT) family kinase protein